MEVYEGIEEWGVDVIKLAQSKKIGIMDKERVSLSSTS